MECVVKDIPIYYEASGEGRTIIVLHGSPIDHRSIRAVLDPIFSERDKWNPIYPDLPGHGKTPAANWIVNNDEMVEVIVEFIEAVIPGKEFAIIGESYGGYLARGIAHLARVAGLLLWTPAKYPRSERKLPPRVVRVRDDDVAAELSSDVEREMFDVLVVQSRTAMDFIRAHIIPGAESADEAFLARVVDTKFSFDVGVRQSDGPTLIVCGRQDSVVGYLDAYEILNKYPMGTIVVVDGAGHFLGFTERRQLFKVLINDWLDCMEGTTN